MNNVTIGFDSKHLARLFAAANVCVVAFAEFAKVVQESPGFIKVLPQDGQ